MVLSGLVFLHWVKRALIILPLPLSRAVLSIQCKSLTSFIHSFNRYSSSACHVSGTMLEHDNIAFLEIVWIGMTE